ncbi:toxin regulator [Metabacillus idriensis]|uniref:toxin regulator n=1 Tax=Metabacillus idriensis TaxID=324768 RepID=UPI002812A8EC|nr:toxin regulator [Metabacillus idriensis]MDR0138503.1 toxin regulator [Metabacillus idriensis]
MNKIFSFSKKHWKYIIVALIALIIGSTSGPSKADVESTQQELKDASKQLEEKGKDLKKVIKENEDLMADKQELEKKVKEAEPFFKLTEQERKEKAAELKKKEEEAKAKEKADAEKKAAEFKAAEEEAKRKAEEKAKRGYDTGITYNQLARTPDDFIGEKVKFKGKVVQVMEGDGTTQIRLAVNDNYDTIIFGEFDSSILKARILENDVITIMGLSTGLLTYESTMGGNISIPGMLIEKID